MIKGSVPVRVAAKVYGKNPQWIREGIVSGYLPICHSQYYTWYITYLVVKICIMTGIVNSSIF